MNKKTLIIIGGIVAALFLCICVVVGGVVAYNMSIKDKIISEPTPQAIIDSEPVDPTPEVVLPEINTPEADIPEVDTPEVKPTEEIIMEIEPTAEAQFDSNAGDVEINNARRVAGKFVLALADQDYKTAIGYTDNAMRNNPDTAGQLKGLVEDQGLQPMIWEWLKDDDQGDYIEFTGVVNFTDNRRGQVVVQTSQEEGEWRVNYIHLSTDGEPVDPGPLSTWSDQRKLEEVTFAKATADYFLMDWIDQDWEGAYLLCAKPMKDQVGGQQNLADILMGVGVTPDARSWDQQDFIEPEGQTRPVIELNGTIDYLGGKSGPITIQLMWEDGFWSVLYFHVETK